jgi:hypothetical protein
MTADELSRNYIWGAKYVSTDTPKYQKLEAPPSHEPPAPGLFHGGTGELLSGVHHHLSQRVNRLLDREPQFGDREDAQEHGAHIQLTRRYILSSASTLCRVFPPD